MHSSPPIRPAPIAVDPTPPLSLLRRVLSGLRALPERPPTQPSPSWVDQCTPLVRHIDAERARTAADRTPTVEIPVVTSTMAAQGVSWR